VSKVRVNTSVLTTIRSLAVDGAIEGAPVGTAPGVAKAVLAGDDGTEDALAAGDTAMPGDFKDCVDEGKKVAF